MNDDVEVRPDQDTEDLMYYRELGVLESEVDLLLEIAFISTMSLNSDHAHTLADMLEMIHPHHAGAFIVRGLRAQSEGDLMQAAQMYLVGMQAELKANEAAILCMNMLRAHGLEGLDLATNIREMLSQSDTGRGYLATYDNSGDVRPSILEKD
ncbi:MAG: hypothetical protein AAGA73_00400 [Pseudomonadota bacterium]